MAGWWTCYWRSGGGGEGRSRRRSLAVQIRTINPVWGIMKLFCRLSNGDIIVLKIARRAGKRRENSNNTT